jgi:5-methylcytosine-specific restriction enzyme A
MSPMRAGHVCGQPGCTVIVRTGSLCPVHARARDLARGTSVERGYGPTWGKTSRAFLSTHPTCVECGRPARHTDHIVARSAGGSDDWSNLQPLCHSCHSRKTATVDSNFSRRVGV